MQHLTTKRTFERRGSDATRTPLNARLVCLRSRPRKQAAFAHCFESPALKSSKPSAGLLLYRQGPGGLELFLAHPGGPFWKGKDLGAWTIPKGVAEAGEDLLAAACREFEEETGLKPQPPFISLGSIRQKAGKLVHAWAWEGDADPSHVTSNTMQTQWPRGSGRWLTFPEVDRCAWFDPPTAREKINPAQATLIDRLEIVLSPPRPAA